MNSDGTWGKQIIRWVTDGYLDEDLPDREEETEDRTKSAKPLKFWEFEHILFEHQEIKECFKRFVNR